MSEYVMSEYVMSEYVIEYVIKLVCEYMTSIEWSGMLQELNK